MYEFPNQILGCMFPLSLFCTLCVIYVEECNTVNNYNFKCFVTGLDNDIEIISCPTTTPTTPSESEKEQSTSIDAFRQETIDESLPRRFTVSREDGIEELKRDILSCYKNNQCCVDLEQYHVFVFRMKKVWGVALLESS